MVNKPPVASGLDTDRAKTIRFYVAEGGAIGMALYPEASQCIEEAVQGYPPARTLEAHCVSLKFDNMRIEKVEIPQGTET